MASLTGQLVAETYKALLKVIDNDILTASEKQITDGFGGGSNVFIDSNGFLRANKYKVTNGLATQFLKADGSLDTNTYLTSITSAQVTTALGYTPVTDQRTLTINGVTYNLTANRSWTVEGTAAVWGNITGTLSNQTDLQAALNAKYNVPAGTISQYIRGDGSLATFPTLPGGLPTGGAAGQILAKIDATDYNTHWIDNYATQTKNEVKLGATLSKGAAVYVSSANGTNMIVSAASNTSESTSSKTFGLLETGGVTNDLVKCVTFGLIAGLDTSTASAGDPVWLGVNGALIFGLANKPVAPAHLVYIGVVTRVQSNNGEIFVNVQNGFELNEIHDVLIQSVANNQGLFYESSSGLWKNKSIATVLGYTPQAQLDGTGFVKASGTTITYDNSTYLTTTDAASTYQRLDKMVSNLLASDTEYPNSNAVIAALALKADAANPVFTGNMTISGAEPKLYFTDTDQNPDYFIGVDAGFFRVYDQTAGATRFVINSDGNISTGVGKSITAGSFIKDGGTATQFLKADGSVDSTDYATVASLANYLLSATAASTYQTLANLSTDLTTSATKYPSVNAVNAGLATKQPLDADLTAIAGLTGTSGFLKKTAADTWTLDTSTYLTTGDASTTYLAITTAASTYQRLDKMVSNLLPSSTEYPNSNAVINALALKADAANPVFTGNMTISGAEPTLYFTDTDQNPDYKVFVDAGYFKIYDQTAGATRFQINSDGNISAGVGKSITAGSFIKESGTASQFLKADGSIDSTSYLALTGGTMSGSIANNTDGSVIIESNVSENNNWLWKENNKLWGHFYFNKGSQAGQTIGTYTTIGAETFYMGGNSGVGIAMPSGWTGYISGSYIAAMISNYTGYIYSASTIYAATSMLVGGNLVLHAANYGSYALPLSGGTMTGTPVFASSYAGGSGDYTDITTPTYTVNPTSGYWRIKYLSNSSTISGVYNFQTGKNVFWGEPSDTGIYNFRGRTVTIESNAIRPLLLEGSSNQYIYIKSSSGYEAMSQYYNPVAGDWYAGIRVTAGLGSLSSYHIYSGVYGADTFILNTDGTAKFASNVTIGNVLDFNGNNSIATLNDKLSIGVNSTLYAWIQSFGSRPLTINALGNNVLINTTTNAGYTLYVNGTGRFEGKLSATKSAKNAYALEIKGGIYGSPRFQLYDLAVDGNAYMGLGTDMSGGAFEFSNYFPRTGGNGRWSVGSWAGDFGSGQYVSGYNEKFFINESLSQFNNVLRVNNLFRTAGTTNDVIYNSGSSGATFGSVIGDVNATQRRTAFFRSSDTNSGGGASVWWGRVDGNGNNIPNAALDSSDGSLGFWVNSGGTGGGTWYNIFNMSTSGITMNQGNIVGNVSGTLNGYTTVIAYGSRNVRGKILVADPDSGNISTQNPETYSGEVRLGAAWARGGIYASGTLSMSTSSAQMDFVFGDVVKASLRSDTGLVLGGFTGGSYNENLRLVDASNNYSVIAFGATGTSGAGRFNFLKNPSDNLEIRNASSTNIFLITQAGVTTFASYVNASYYLETSDKRLKTLIESNPIIDGIEKLEAKLYEKNGKIELGYFAQDAELIMPYAVQKNHDGFLNLSYREIHTAKIARLEKEVAELKAQLNLN